MSQVPTLGRLIAASITPVLATGRIDRQRLATHVGRLLGAGCDQVSIFGTSGEGPSLGIDDRIAAFDALLDAGIAADRLIPGVMTNSLLDGVTLLEHWDRAGAAAALVMPPTYFSATDDGVVAYVRALLDGSDTDIPIVLYNFPAFSGVTFTPGLVDRLRTALPGRIAGIKDSTGDLDSGLALVAAHPDLAIYTGDDRLVPALVAAGGRGMIGGIPNLFPEDCAAMVKEGGGDPALADRRIRAIDGIGGGTPALKALVADIAGDEAYALPVPPLLPLSDTVRDSLRRELGIAPAHDGKDVGRRA